MVNFDDNDDGDVINRIFDNARREVEEPAANTHQPLSPVNNVRDIENDGTLV